VVAEAKPSWVCRLPAQHHPILGAFSVVWAVSAYAVADPQRRGLGVEEAVSFAPPGSDGHEAVLALQHVGLLQQPVQAFAVAGTTTASMKCRS
jgi:hypothetical protein